MTVTLELLCLAVLTFRLVLMYNFLVPSRFWWDAKVSGLLAIIVVRPTQPPTSAAQLPVRNLTRPSPPVTSTRRSRWPTSSSMSCSSPPASPPFA